MPVWGVWEQGAAWFSSSRQSRKARNIQAHPRAAMTTDNPLQPVVVEGVVGLVTGDEAIERFTAWVNAKYRTDLAVDFFAANAYFRLGPRWVFGLDEGDLPAPHTLGVRQRDLTGDPVPRLSPFWR